MICPAIVCCVSNRPGFHCKVWVQVAVQTNLCQTDLVGMTLNRWIWKTYFFRCITASHPMTKTSILYHKKRCKHRSFSWSFCRYIKIRYDHMIYSCRKSSMMGSLKLELTPWCPLSMTSAVVCLSNGLLQFKGRSAKSAKVNTFTGFVLSMWGLQHQFL